MLYTWSFSYSTVSCYTLHQNKILLSFSLYEWEHLCADLPYYSEYVRRSLLITLFVIACTAFRIGEYFTSEILPYSKNCVLLWLNNSRYRVTYKFVNFCWVCIHPRYIYVRTQHALELNAVSCYMNHTYLHPYGI